MNRRKHMRGDEANNATLELYNDSYRVAMFLEAAKSRLRFRWCCRIPELPEEDRDGLGVPRTSQPHCVR